MVKSCDLVQSLWMRGVCILEWSLEHHTKKTPHPPLGNVSNLQSSKNMPISPARVREDFSYRPFQRLLNCPFNVDQAK